MDTYDLYAAFSLRKPSYYFDGLDRDGLLETEFPELAALKGRQQPLKYHPEGDAYIHTLMAVDRAKELINSHAVMFGALVHDLGKAVTDCQPPDFHHYNHEALGVPLVDKVCERLRVPPHWQEVAVLATKYHLHIHRFFELRPFKKAELLEKLGDLANLIAMVAQADAQGRGPTFKDKPYPQYDAVVRAMEIMERNSHLNLNQKAAELGKVDWV